jgi:hypothetical protein
MKNAQTYHKVTHTWNAASKLTDFHLQRPSLVKGFSVLWIKPNLILDTH